jgi:hypothetical protein
VPFLLSSRFNLPFTNSSFSGRKKNLQNKVLQEYCCKPPGLEENSPELRATKNIAFKNSQAAKPEEAPGEEGRVGRRGQKQESQPPTKTRHYYGLANTTKNQNHHSCISDCKIAQEKVLGFHEAQQLKKELHHHSCISNCKITEENMHKNVHERHMRRYMMDTFCMNFWKPKKNHCKSDTSIIIIIIIIIIVL